MSRFDKFHTKLARLGFSSYEEYLQSPHWQDLKRRYYASKLSKKCFVCKKKPIIPSFHHRTYKRLGKERLMDIVLTCKECHQLIHKVFSFKFAQNPGRTDLWKITKLVSRKRGQFNFASVQQ